MIQRETIVFVLIGLTSLILAWYSFDLINYLTELAKCKRFKIRSETEVARFLIALSIMLIFLMAIIGALDSLQ